jgi:NAD+ synthase
MTYIHRYTAANRERFREAYMDDPGSVFAMEPAECERVMDQLCSFYRGHLETTGLDGYVLGLSGGLDSTVTAHLLVEAVGPENVFGVIMPGPHSDEDHVEDARDVADRLDIRTNDPERFRERIGDPVDTLEKLGRRQDGDRQRLKRGNILARCRMTVLRDIAKARDALVAGTTNASERDLGYMTLAADGLGGVDNEALYELYKTSVRDLARFLDVDKRIIEKAPTADLWEGQRDKDELLHDYDILDRILAGLVLDIDDADIVEAVDAVAQQDVEAIRRRKQQNAYKRSLPAHPSFS